MAVHAMVFMGRALLAGQLATQVGASLTVTVGGVGCALAALVFALRLPALRREARHLSITLEMAERAHVTG